MESTHPQSTCNDNKFMYHETMVSEGEAMVVSFLSASSPSHSFLFVTVASFLEILISKPSLAFAISVTFLALNLTM